MKLIKKVLWGLTIIIVFILVAGLFMDKQYKVERTILINEQSDVIINRIKSLKKFQSWSPWADEDPNQKNTFEGIDGTVGSKLKWEGNEKVGKGTMTITAITDSCVTYDLNFIEPFKSISKSYYITKKKPQGSLLTWGMIGENPYPINVITSFIDMDGMIGKDFEKGRLKLRNQLEKK